MKIETLIIGQGLSGTWLSYWLRQQGHSFLVIDREQPQSPSRIASGVINPVTGRVLAKTWMAEQLLPFALDSYTAIGNQLNFPCINSSEILHCFPTLQMAESFQKRLPELPEYLGLVPNETAWQPYFSFYHGLGSIHPALLIDLNGLLHRWRQLLKQEGILQEDIFKEDALEWIPGGVRYEGIEAKQIVFCNGVSAMDYRYFDRLPFAPNKGEALLLEVEGLPSGRIYKKGISLVPFPHYQETGNEKYFWAGSTYDNRFTDPMPGAAFREKTLAQLRDWLKVPFTLVDHWAGIRPATIDRRPFVGKHPHRDSLYMLDGMGTKGCSLAPWFGRQLAAILSGSAESQPVQPEADLSRFSRLLA
ncbi:NAD(P)/FAD-dependent oxidoreductase [Flavihumibacter petaseus]|uniref:NAD(P)/FAD-dependent oxidoreductase n=1 Tax=Flavihumibacter petaseus TaxID=549295 RepID=UPI00061CE89E|nr:FAD-binding oxidoreductase [Flavihumibacter petaseus]